MLSPHSVPHPGALLGTLLLATFAIPVLAEEGTAWVTPHESYSSSIGVLGCKVNTNRIAYWPNSISCTNLCVELSYEGRTVHLLRIDQSEGAHDVSYDAWNYLLTGYSATEKPVAGGATAMTYRDVDVSMCADIIHTAEGKLPLSASNSMNFVASCLADKESWVGKGNYELYNILDPICSWGNDEVCSLDWEGGKNQADCPTPLGTPSVLGDTKEETTVWNIQYPTGKKVKAGAAPEAPGPGVAWEGVGGQNDAAGVLGVARGLMGGLLAGWAVWMVV
ncbi:hypothetical protein V8F20_006028 [Naviculisporaceae sp. PSN 640]